MTSKIIEQKEIEIGGEKAIINLLRIGKETKYGEVVYFRIVGHFVGHKPDNTILKKLREKYKNDI